MNNRQIFAATVGVLSLVTGILAVRVLWFPFSGDAPPVPPQQDIPPARLGKISGPYTYKNLSVYLVHGDTTYVGDTPLILDEALKAKLAIVHETADVNELAIENLSRSDDVFVQAGDIVKGGQQDRVLGVDLIVPARSGRMPIDAFCVEHGRWTQRLNESPVAFEEAPNMIASKDLKLAAKHSKSQTEVWDQVNEEQAKLSVSTRADVQSNTSRSSLQLSLENEKVRESAHAYIEKLSSVVADAGDVVGFVFAINGEINSSDIYSSQELFTKLWPRLLKAAAIEAVAELSDRSKTSDVFPTIDEIAAFLSDADTAAVSDRKAVTNRISIVTRESKDSVLIETLDAAQNGASIHRNYLVK